MTGSDEVRNYAETAKVPNNDHSFNNQKWTGPESQSIDETRRDAGKQVKDIKLEEFVKLLKVVFLPE